MMRRNPGVYVRGRVRHADHATITLHGWHRVSMNTEGRSKAMKNVAFLDRRGEPVVGKRLVVVWGCCGLSH